MNSSISVWINQLGTLINLSKQLLPLTLLLTAFFWLIHMVNFVLGYRLNVYGIYPRHTIGLRGIFFSPFLHGDFNHLFFNTIPLFILINLMLLNGIAIFMVASLFIILVGGFAVWLLGRSALHVGASGLIMGYWGFLLMQAILAPSAIVIIIAIVCVYYLGGLLISVIPSANKGTSWEAHLFGCLSGMLAALFIFDLIKT